MSTDTQGATARHEAIANLVIDMLKEIAPEVEPESMDPAADMRYELEIDSIDFLNLMIAIDERLGIDVPESDYGNVISLDSLVSYLVNRGAEDRV